MPRVIQARRSYSENIESLRRHLPVHSYLFLMHQAATTGVIPILGDDGRPVPFQTAEALERATVGATDRLKAAQYLIDKAMPAPRADFLPPDPIPVTVIPASDQLQNMSSHELERALSRIDTPDSHDSHDSHDTPAFYAPPPPSEYGY